MTPIKFYTCAEFSKLPLPAPKWLIENLIPGDGWTLVYAYPKVGKSLFCAQVGHALATGTGSVLGFRPSPTPLRTLYIQADTPDRTFQEQVIKLCPSSPMMVTLSCPPYAPERHRPLLDLLISDAKPQVIIWDCLNKLTTEDYNTMTGAARAIMRLTCLAPSVPFLLIHHARKPQREIADDTRIGGAGSFFLHSDANTTINLRMNEHKGKVVRHNRVNEDLYMDAGRDERGAWIVAPSPAPTGKIILPPR